MKNYMTCRLPLMMFDGKAVSVLEHMFATLGNGVGLDSLGYLAGDYRGNEAFVFGEVESLNWIYPWVVGERYQPFRSLVGCRSPGFKDAVRYFAECVRITPDDISGILEWKKNIHIFEDVLLNAPTIDIEFFMDDGGEYISQLGGVVSPEHGMAVRFFDMQDKCVPKEIVAEVSQMWRDHDYGNDVYIYRGELGEEFFEMYPRLYLWLKHCGIVDGDQFIVHYWW